MRQKKWVLRQTPGDYAALGKALHVEPVAVITARNRGVAEADLYAYFHIQKENMHDPALLLDAGKLCDILQQKISKQKHIRIIGDYDIDGVSSVYILLDALQRFGANVDYRIPHRITDGYGLNRRLVEEAIKDGVDTLLTCDNGIAAYDEIRLAKDAGMTVLVSDHHEVPYVVDESGAHREKLPPADAIVDVKRSGETYPFPDICGAVTAWKLMLFLEQRSGVSIGAERYIEEAAFATIGDVMTLVGENRTIVGLGLSAMRKTTNKGLSALLDVCGVDRGTLNSYTIGFRLGPCINATGRLREAAVAEELLCAGTEEEATRLAEQLFALNTERQRLTDEALERCLALLEQEGWGHDTVLVVFEPSIHESVAGIVAGKLREQFYKPTIVLTASGEADVVKGSARSIPGYHMFEKLSECRELFLRFGGHAMAAGMSLRGERIGELRAFLNANHGMTDEALLEKLYIDVSVPFSYLTISRVEALSVLEPIGNGNEKPLFAAKGCQVKQFRLMGAEKNHLRLTLTDASGAALPAVYFQQGAALYAYIEAKKDRTLDIAYSPSINEYRGERNVQLLISDYR